MYSYSLWGPFADEYVKHGIAGYLTDDLVFPVRHGEGLFLLKNPGGKRLYFQIRRHVSDARDLIVDRGHDGPDGQHFGSRDFTGKFGDMVIGRADHQFFGRSDLNDGTVFHDRDAVGKPDRFIKIVGNEDNGFLEKVLQPQKFVLHFTSDEWIEGRERFI